MRPPLQVSSNEELWKSWAVPAAPARLTAHLPKILGDHPAERYSRQECAVSLSLWVRPSRSRGVPCESFDASENLPKEGPRQVAFGQLQDEVPGMPNEAPAGLEEPLLETQNSMRAPSSTTRFGGMLKKSVAALALRAMKLNRRFRHRIIGAGPVGRSRELST